MKILVCIPIIINPFVAREAINQVIGKENVTVILCNNGGGHHINNLLSEFKDVDNVRLWTRPQNTFVNPIWNDFIEYFISMKEWDRLIILNSDLTLVQNWDEILKNRWEKRPGEIIVPKITNDKTIVYENQNPEFGLSTTIYSDIAGVMITMNLRQAEIIFPIPSEIKIWFGDNWIYQILITLGEKVVVPENLIAFHHHSTSVSTVPGVHNIIEKDKLAWAETIEHKMVENIKELKAIHNLNYL